VSDHLALSRVHTMGGLPPASTNRMQYVDYAWGYLFSAALHSACTGSSEYDSWIMKVIMRI
jgi:hypothetical protein